MSEKKHKQEVFARFGEAAYFAQFFETQIENLLLLVALCKDKKITQQGLEKIDTGLSTKSLGSLIVELKKHLELSHEFEDLLKHYLDQRNYLMHDFFYKNSGKLVLSAGRETMIAELRSLSSTFHEAALIAQDMSEKLNSFAKHED